MADCRDCKNIKIVEMDRDRNAEFQPVYQCQIGKVPKTLKWDDIDCICDEYEWRGG